MAFITLLEKTARKLPFEVITVLVVFLVGISLFAPTIANAVVDLGPRLPSGTELDLAIQAMQNETKPFGELPQAGDTAPKRIFVVPVTAYTSDPAETDDTPTITASGTTTRRGVIAANFLPFGAHVRFPDLYGDEEFVVEDRMNARYDKHIDIWMEEKADALNFGLKTATIEVF